MKAMIQKIKENQCYIWCICVFLFSCGVSFAQDTSSSDKSKVFSLDYDVGDLSKEKAKSLRQGLYYKFSFFKQASILMDSMKKPKNLYFIRLKILTDEVRENDSLTLIKASWKIKKILREEGSNESAGEDWLSFETSKIDNGVFTPEIHPYWHPSSSVDSSKDHFHFVGGDTRYLVGKVPTDDGRDEPFQPLFPVPVSYKKSLERAFRVLKKEPKLLPWDKGAKKDMLIRYAGNNNPLLTILALRKLFRADVTRKSLHQILMSATGPSIAAVVFNLLLEEARRPKKKTKSYMKTIEKRIRKTNSDEVLKNILLGVRTFATKSRSLQSQGQISRDLKISGLQRMVAYKFSSKDIQKENIELRLMISPFLSKFKHPFPFHPGANANSEDR